MNELDLSKKDSFSYKDLFGHARWESVTPVVSFTEVLGGGSITYVLRYKRIGKAVFFKLTITPAGGATVASTAGTSYVVLPTMDTVDQGMVTAYSVTALTGDGVGAIDTTNKRAYPPTWTASTNTRVVSGWYEG